MNDAPGTIVPLLPAAAEFDWTLEDRYAYAMSALGWAVGRLDGQGETGTYAQQAYARLMNPLVRVPPLDRDAA
jgi:hypothetical protein